MDGVRFPVKQALEAVIGVSRTTFTSRVARSAFARLGLPTSESSNGSGRPEPRSTSGAVAAPAAPAAVTAASAPATTHDRRELTS
jgi:hypothetical protein